MIAFIAAAEIGFWVLVAAGLLTRYALRRRDLGMLLLAMTPLVDLALLAAVTLDLRDGATASTGHALAAVYLGVSVAFGRRFIAWADVRVAHRLAGGPPPAPKPTSGSARTRAERQTWLRHALAWAIGCGLLMGATVLVGDADRTKALTAMAGLWTVVLAIDAAFSLPAQKGTAPSRGRA
ncbi:hypothetical protein [Patulibacter americanus]|uniref:hypothetical protein n=1 Tax=Patulibacter americanus TaxID=588672 RepID=UPI0003B53794|nr:hypothetical protein [Patulibacter americanus]